VSDDGFASLVTRHYSLPPKYLRRKTVIFWEISPKKHPFCAAGITLKLHYFEFVQRALETVCV
jgi:hypothetical protein